MIIVELMCSALFSLMLMAGTKIHRGSTKRSRLRIFVGIVTWLSLTYCTWLSFFVVLPENTPESFSEMSFAQRFSVLTDIFTDKLYRRRDWMLCFFVGIVGFALRLWLSVSSAKEEHN